MFDSLGGIAEIQFRKLSEALVDNLLDIKLGKLTIGENIAKSLSQGTLDVSFKLKQVLEEGGTSMQAKLRSVLQEFGFILDKISSNRGGFGAAALPSVVAQPALRSANQDLTDAISSGGTIAADKQKKALEDGASTINIALAIGAQLIGQAIGGSGKFAGIGAGIGSLLGLANPALSFIGATAGGFLGGLFDTEREFIAPISSLTNATNRNTIAIENSNKLLELSREFINAPARFSPNGLFAQGQTSGGIVIQNVNVNASSSVGGQAAGRAFVDELNSNFNSGVRRSRSTAKTF